MYFGTTVLLIFRIVTHSICASCCSWHLTNTNLLSPRKPHPHEEVSVLQIMPGPRHIRQPAQGHAGGECRAGVQPHTRGPQPGSVTCPQGLHHPLPHSERQEGSDPASPSREAGPFLLASARTPAPQNLLAGQARRALTAITENLSIPQLHAQKAPVFQNPRHQPRHTPETSRVSVHFYSNTKFNFEVTFEAVCSPSSHREIHPRL